MKKGKWQYFITVIAVAATVSSAVLLLLGRNVYVKRENLLLAYEKTQVSGIVCYGDSLTEGACGDGVTFPNVLKDRLEEKRIYIPVVNMGIGGENSNTIAARAGGTPFQVMNFTIPESTERVEVEFIKEEGKPIRLLERGSSGVNPCVIYGVEGTLSCEIEEGVKTTYYFSRSQEGESVDVPEGSEVETWASKNYNDYIFVLFIGANKGYNSPEDLIAQQRSVLELQKKHAGKYIIIGLPTGTREENVELEKVMQEAYGDKYINLREYMSTQAIYDAGIKPTEEDLARMEEGRVPSSLLADHIHFKAKGYELIGNLVYERMEELGYFTELEDIVKEYGGIW